jgi:Rrf2 family protein
MISQTGKYALRILGFLVDHPGQWALGRDIARETGIPANYLSKILNQLRKGGFVLSQKGWGGGFVIDERAGGQPIATVLELFDGKPDRETCVFELKPCNPANPCALHHRWEPVRSEFAKMINTVRVSDLRVSRVSD